LIIYSEKVIENFMSSQNAYSMPDADAEGSFGDPACGDAVAFYLRVKDNYIQEISYLVFGCCASIATSSMTSVLAKGKKLRRYSVTSINTMMSVEIKVLLLTLNQALDERRVFFMKATVDKEKCTGCGQCVDICPAEAITLDNDIAVVSDECIECGACADECPTGAITLQT